MSLLDREILRLVREGSSSPHTKLEELAHEAEVSPSWLRRYLTSEITRRRLGAENGRAGQYAKTRVVADEQARRWVVSLDANVREDALAAMAALV